MITTTLTTEKTMSYVVSLTHAHPLCPFTNFSEFSTIGSFITLLDFVLVNGGPNTNISSITRTEDIALVKTATNHNFVVGDKVLHSDTGEANFNGVKRVKVITAPDEYIFDCEDTGAETIGAVGTTKWAAAGWTKFWSGTNQAIYQSTNLYDGQPLFLQIDDYNATYIRIREARDLTAWNTAEAITPDAYLRKNLTNLSFGIYADNKTVHYNVNQDMLFSFGYGKKLDPGQETYGNPSVYGPAATTNTQANGEGYMTPYVGTKSNRYYNSTPDLLGINLLGSENLISQNSVGVSTIFGVSMRSDHSISTANAPTFLAYQQIGLKGINSQTGKFTLIPVDIWEKIGEIGDCFAPNCRVRGLYQSYSRLPREVVETQLSHNKDISINVDGSPRNFKIINSGGSSIVYWTQLYIDVDNWDD